MCVGVWVGGYVCFVFLLLLLLHTVVSHLQSVLFAVWTELLFLLFLEHLTQPQLQSL